MEEGVGLGGQQRSREIDRHPTWSMAMIEAEKFVQPRIGHAVAELAKQKERWPVVSQSNTGLWLEQQSTTGHAWRMLVVNLTECLCPCLLY